MNDLSPLGIVREIFQYDFVREVNYFHASILNSPLKSTAGT